MVIRNSNVILGLIVTVLLLAAVGAGTAILADDDKSKPSTTESVASLQARVAELSEQVDAHEQALLQTAVILQVYHDKISEMIDEMNELTRQVEALTVQLDELRRRNKLQGNAAVVQHGLD